MATATQTGEDLVRQAICAWESAVDSSVKIQEECTQWARQMVCNSNMLTEWCNKGQTVRDELMAKSQESIDDMMRVMNCNAESGVKLMQKMIDARPGEVNPDAQLNLAKWWESAFEAMQANANAVLQANGRILSNWSELSRKVNGAAADTISELAQKTAEQAEKMTNSTAENLKKMAKKASGN